MRVADIFSAARSTGTQPISFEMFPPKGELTLDKARDVAQKLTSLKPSFISVTCSAGGSGNGATTAPIASMIAREFDTPSVAHLTCVGCTHEQLAQKIDEYKVAGIENVLALRGDLPQNTSEEDAAQSAYPFAKDMIPELVDAGFCVGAAAYPEGHIACEDLELSVRYLKEKQDAGASFFVTQLFFDNEYFFRFRDLAEKAGITVPITAGIMPFMSKQQISRMVFMCGASLPSPVIKILAKYEDDPESLRQAGIEYACRQLEGLRDAGADGLHVYTMNRPSVALAAIEALRA
jgi:5,10-methylenetetrahydrofolate reductase